MHAPVLFKQIVAVSQNDVGVNVIDAREEEVIRVDKVVGDRRVVGLNAHKQCPAEIENFSRGARRFSI